MVITATTNSTTSYWYEHNPRIPPRKPLILSWRATGIERKFLLWCCVVGVLVMCRSLLVPKSFSMIIVIVACRFFGAVVLSFRLHEQA